MSLKYIDTLQISIDLLIENWFYSTLQNSIAHMEINLQVEYYLSNLSPVSPTAKDLKKKELKNLKKIASKLLVYDTSNIQSHGINKDIRL